MFRKVSIAAASLATLALLTGCAQGADKKDDAAPAENAAEQQNGNADGGAENAAGGDFSLTVDGSAVELKDPVVSCTEAGGKYVIAVATSDPNPELAAGIGATLSSDKTSVEAVGAVTADGKAVAYAAASGQGSAEVKADGDTYTITGKGLVTDMANPTAQQEAEFELKVTCK